MTTVLIKKYNPLEMSKDDVLALATGREKLLDIMMSEMKVCLKKGSNQHFVLHGPRGIGKSFFTRLLKIHHDQSDDFKNSLFFQLPEEQANINFAADLLDVISTLMEGGKLIDTAPKWTISDNQWQNSKQRLKEAINELKKNGKHHVFVTQENLQAFIPKLDKIESSRLREFLSDFDEVTIIGSSLRPDVDNDYSKRLFQVFKKLDIEPWTADDFLTYYDKLAQRSNYNKEQLENLKKSKNKIKAISQFTGGSPRLAVILSKLILEKNILDTAQLLDGIIDELTTYYQDITNDIPSKSKILFDMLIRKGENMTQSTLAASFEPPLEQKDIARSFAWLTDNYYVISSKQARGNTKYFYVRDRLYVLYYQKRQVYADVDFSFVGVFVDFLNEFYSKKEWMRELSNMDLNHAYSLQVLSSLAQREGIYLSTLLMESEILRDSLIMRYSLKHNYNSLNNKRNNLKKKLKQKSEILEYTIMGYKYFEHRDYENAIASLQNAINLHPTDPHRYFNLGIVFYKNGEYDKAIISYEKAIQLNPKYVDAYNNLGMAFIEKGEYEKAISIFEKAIDLNPKDSEVYNNLGNVFEKIGDYGKAISSYKNAIFINPVNASTFYNLGIAYSNKNDLDKSKNAYLKAIELNPKDYKAYTNLGNKYLDEDDYDNAISMFRNSSEINPNDPVSYNNLGIAFTGKGDYDKAILAYLKAIELNPGYTNAISNLGNAYFKKGDLDNAIRHYNNAIELNPKYYNAYNNIGSSYAKKGDYAKALIHFEKAIEINPTYTDAYYNLGLVYNIQIKYEKSINTLLKGLIYKPNNIKFISNSISILIKQQQWPYLIQFHEKWTGDKPFSSIVGESIYRVIIENQSNKFFHFKNTFNSIRTFDYININEVINGLCIGLYKDGDMDFLRQVVDELSHDFADDAFVKINLEVYKYLLNPEELDINQLHPDVRTVVNSILQDK